MRTANPTPNPTVQMVEMAFAGGKCSGPAAKVDEAEYSLTLLLPAGMDPWALQGMSERRVTADYTQWVPLADAPVRFPFGEVNDRLGLDALPLPDAVERVRRFAQGA